MKIDSIASLKDFFDSKVAQYNQPSFIQDDPICVPHAFTKKQDIEIAGFFAAVFAWGNRTTIIQKSFQLMKLMDNSPHEFCLHHQDQDLKRLVHFKHRTFNATDLLYFISFLQQHYKKYDSLESAFTIPKEKEMEMKNLHNLAHENDKFLEEVKKLQKEMNSEGSEGLGDSFSGKKKKKNKKNESDFSGSDFSSSDLEDGGKKGKTTFTNIHVPDFEKKRKKKGKKGKNRKKKNSAPFRPKFSHKSIKNANLSK